MKWRNASGCLKAAVCVGAFLAAVSLVWADGYRNPPESASALGRDGGKIADMDDASAVTINPANMADVKSSSVLASFTLGWTEREFTGASGVTESSDDPWGYLPSVYGVMPVAGGDYAVGVGVTVPYGRSSTWDKTASFAQAGAPYYAQLYVVNVNPGIATRLTENLAVGIGVSLYASDVELKQFFPVGGTLMDSKFEADGTSYGFNAGLRWDIAAGHRLGLTYRSPFDIEYDGDFTVRGAPMSQDFETEIKFPTIVGAGYSLPLGESVRLEFDVEWAEHSRNKDLPVEIEGVPPEAIPQDWEDNWSYGFGLAWDCTEAWTLRGGCMYLETPSPTRTLMPVGSEEDAPILSVGCGYNSGGHVFDLAYAVGIYGGRTVADNVNPAVNGEHDFESHLLAMAYGYRF